MSVRCRVPLACLCAAALLAACATPGPVSTAGPAPMPASIPAAPPQIHPRLSLDEQLVQLRQAVAETAQAPRLGKADLLSISVYDEPDLSVESIPVRPDGMISFPLVGDVPAAGLTAEQLAADLTERLRRFLLAPKVSVIVHAFNSRQFSIQGAVARPGLYPLVTDVTITGAVAQAGGLVAGPLRPGPVEGADLGRAYLARRGRPLPVDFERLLRQGDLRFDVQLQPGDAINIPVGLAKEVYILGEVKTPALLAFREDMSLARTLALTGGFTQDADLSRVHLVRGSLGNPTRLVVDFDQVLRGEARDLPLEAGDIIYIPPTGLASWARMLDRLMPTVQALQTGILLRETVR